MNQIIHCGCVLFISIFATIFVFEVVIVAVKGWPWCNNWMSTTRAPQSFRDYFGVGGFGMLLMCAPMVIGYFTLALLLNGEFKSAIMILAGTMTLYVVACCAWGILEFILGCSLIVLIIPFAIIEFAGVFCQMVYWKFMSYLNNNALFSQEKGFVMTATSVTGLGLGSAVPNKGPEHTSIDTPRENELLAYGKILGLIVVIAIVFTGALCLPFYLLGGGFPKVVIPATSEVLAVRRVSANESYRGDGLYRIKIEYETPLEEYLDRRPDQRRWFDQAEKVSGKKETHALESLEITTSEYQAKRAEAVWRRYSNGHYHGPSKRFVVSHKNLWLKAFYPVEM